MLRLFLLDLNDDIRVDSLSSIVNNGDILFIRNTPSKWRVVTSQEALKKVESARVRINKYAFFEWTNTSFYGPT